MFVVKIHKILCHPEKHIQEEKLSGGLTGAEIPKINLIFWGKGNKTQICLTYHFLNKHIIRDSILFY